MISEPSVFLYTSMFLHGAGLLLMLAGYSTPYWTLVTSSTGEDRSLGLVVSCFKSGCQLVRLTDSKDLTVTVFSMCTANLLLGVVISQVFCLSVCNYSWRTRNMGLGLSYVSFLIAVSVGVSQALYHIDIQEEVKSDVTSSVIGWSCYSMVASSGAFFCGALSSVVDYLKRSRFLQFQMGKINAVQDNVNDNGKQEKFNTHHQVIEFKHKENANSHRVSQTTNVDTALSSVGQDFHKSTNESKKSELKSNSILVSQVSRSCRESGAGEGVCLQQHARVSAMASEREGLAIVADALKKYTLNNPGRSDGMQCLPSIAEEATCSDKVRQSQTKPKLTRQQAIDADSNDLPEYSINTNINKNEDKDRVPGISSDKQISSNKVGAVTEKLEKSLAHARECIDDIEKKPGKESRTTEETISKSRRNSAVEDALFSVNQLLEGTVSGKHTSSHRRLSQDELLDLRADGHQTGRWREKVHEKTAKGLQVADEAKFLPQQAWSTDHLHKSGIDHGNSSREHGADYGSRVSHGTEGTSRRWSQLQQRLSQNETRKSLIVECLSKDLGKRKRKIFQ